MLKQKIIMELTLFGPEEAFVYQVPTQQTTNGPRAELWDVQNPLATVAVTLTRALDASDTCLVRLRDPESKELFAEAPITSPLHTCVERAIDSSRYFCVRGGRWRQWQARVHRPGIYDAGASRGFLRGANRSPAVRGAERAGKGRGWDDWGVGRRGGAAVAAGADTEVEFECWVVARWGVCEFWFCEARFAGEDV